MDFLCLDFINTQWFDWRGSDRTEDRLDNPEVVSRLMAKWNMEGLPAPTDATLSELKALRAHLRALTERLARGERLATADLAPLNAALARAPQPLRLHHTESGYRLEPAPLALDWNWAMAQIAASFARLLAQDDVRRLKVCQNDDCRWVFYDESRNRTRRWCDDKTCGNLLKVRRHRARQKGEAD